MTPPRWSLRQSLTRTYLSLDPRSLGLGRIVLGVALLVDLLRRAPEVATWYSNEGLLPNHTVLWQPPAARLISFFFMVSLPHEAVIAFALCAFCYVAFLLGWRTRLFHLLSFLCAVSLHTRILYAESAGNVVLLLVCFWTLFLPMGRRFSVDGLLASLRRHPEHVPADLRADRSVALPDATTPVVSLAVLALLLQLAAIYLFTYTQRTGASWKDGTALHYLLHQDRLVTAVGVWAREGLPPSVLEGATWAALALAAAAPVLLLAPIGATWSRRLALALLPAFHLGTAILLNLGSYVVGMLAFFPLLLSAEDWRLMAAWAERRRLRRERVVVFDVDCGVCFQIVRVLRRMDLIGRLRWVGNDDRAAIPADVDSQLLERTILVIDPSSGRRWTRADAFAEIFAALPLGRLFAWVLRLPLIRTLAGAAYDRFAANRTRISVWLGLAACGVPTPVAARQPSTARPPAADGRTWLPSRPLLRELGVAFALIVLGNDLLASNAAVPPALRPPQPLWMHTLAVYPHLVQRWSMFAPDPPKGDQTIVVDAVTSDGRHVDPYSRVGRSAMAAEYTARIPDTGVYHQAFLEWMLRYPERTGYKSDQLVSFEAKVVQDESPPPGEKQPRGARERVFYKWPR